ncbi:unnamed protein product [Clonostachys rhizophaga]|uniref:Aminoglycoside phosphotransferase domain-containing protein n=1 Tax=Clonostachys rhizophaga TaxID=160324 RepID=A0A9N9VFU3_9HYPO|nr:unnamed protein product [Clonostachys rhizophaga]
MWNALPSLSPRPDPSHLRRLKPLTSEQYEERRNKFIRAIDENAICTLASAHNKNLPCRIAESRTANGSFNICFFLHFHTVDKTWVVRVPLEPVLHNAWDKVQSEVCTMRQISPFPGSMRTAATDFSATSRRNIMIMDCVEGGSLTDKKILESPQERRLQFYTELVDILAQLRTLEFPVGGSLMPHWSAWSKPAVSEVLSIPLNQFQTDGYPTSVKSTKSAVEFINEQYRILWETYLLPASDMSRKGLEKELFALDAIKKWLPKLDDNNTRRQFVLAHTDLRYSNIMVDDLLHIQGIIDWEWACTVPTQMFIPPAWIITSDVMFSEFRCALTSRRDSSAGRSLLMHQWTQDNEINLHITNILRQSSQLTSIFYRHIYPKLFTESRDVILSEYSTTRSGRWKWKGGCVLQSVTPNTSRITIST